MSTSMFSTFTSTDRRKKVVTYGKSSRLSSIPTPPPVSNEDAPSPERPRKRVAPPSASLKKLGGTSTANDSLGNARANLDSPDVFDVPSEDEFMPRSIKPSRRLPTKHRSPEEDFQVPLSDDETAAQNRKLAKTIQPLRNAGPARPAAPTAKKLQKPARVPKPVQVPPSSSSDPIAPQTRRGKTPQPTQKGRQGTNNGDSVQRPVAVEKATSRAATPGLPAPKASKKAMTTLGPAPKKALAKSSAKKSEDLGVFDLPLSDEEVALPARKLPRQVLVGRTKEPVKPIESTTNTSQKDAVESDDSNASKKRKRQGSMSSVSTVKPTIERKREPSGPQRSRKYLKKEGTVSPGHESHDQPGAAPTRQHQSVVPAINKPRRTRLRTVPVLTRPTMAKGQSSPATLNSMLPNRQVSKPSPVPESPEVAALEDETMYEIPDPMATPVRAPKSAIPGSVTPRQKALFSGLLGGSTTSTTPMPSIAALQLTDRKPTTLLGALSRSKSDLTYSAQTRKTRLIDTLRHAETSSEDEDENEDSASNSGEEPKERIHSLRQSSQEPHKSAHSADTPSDHMDADMEIAADSQTSQATSGFGMRSRSTYAKSRSFLKETNPEDDFLISMDLDDNLGLDSRKKDSLSEDEEDPMSQVRANHELKRQGQQTKFDDEAQMFIDDMSDKTSNSIRRSAILEFCPKIENEIFTEQLLDSYLAPRFFKNIFHSKGETIFDFASAIAIIFVLGTNSSYTVLHQIYQTGISATLVKLASIDVDIRKIAKDRKTNLSKIVKDSVASFGTRVEQSSFWSSRRPEKVSPQIVSLKALESLIVGLRSAGSTEALVDQEDIAKLVDIAINPSERLKSGKPSAQDTLVLDMILSTLEAASVANQKQSMWSLRTLQRLADIMPVFLQSNTASSTLLAMKLCMNLTNNKPKACQPFSGQPFVQPLMSSIIHNFGLLRSELDQEQRTEILDSLVLCLGAMINLAECSDQARLNVDDGQEMIDTLVNIFLEGSERAAQASSMEESQSNVAVGYLTVLLGNLCLNNSVRSKVRTQLPDRRLDMVIDKIREFVQLHEHVDSKAAQFEGAEGQETWQSYTERLMLVVENLEKVKN